jgi:hypothetical protein
MSFIFALRWPHQLAPGLDRRQREDLGVELVHPLAVVGEPAPHAVLLLGEIDQRLVDAEQLAQLILELGSAVRRLDPDLHHVERDVGGEVERALDRCGLGDQDLLDLVRPQLDLEQMGIADALERRRGPEHRAATSPCQES